jgi:hypothetical protein
LEARTHVDNINDIVHGRPAPIAVQRYAAMSTLGFDDKDGLMQKGSSKTNATASSSRMEEKIARVKEVVRPADLQSVTLHEPEPVDVTSANVSSPARRHRRTELEVMDQPDWNTKDRGSREGFCSACIQDLCQAGADGPRSRRRNYTREGIEIKAVKPMHKVPTQMVTDMLTKMKVSRLLRMDMLAAGMIEPPKIKDLSKSKT